MRSIKILLLAVLAVSAGVCFIAAGESVMAMQQRAERLTRADLWQERFFAVKPPQQAAAIEPAPMMNEEDEVVALPKPARPRFSRKARVLPVPAPAIQEIKPEDAVRLALRSKRASFEQCYDRELKKQANFSGFIVVAFSVSAKGEVTDARVEEANRRDAVVGRCIVAQLRSLKLPALTSEADLVLPIRLQSRGST